MAECERCQEREEVVPEGTYIPERGQVLCNNCEQTENEAAYERSLSDFYGGSGPQTQAEQMDKAYELMRERRRW